MTPILEWRNVSVHKRKNDYAISNVSGKLFHGRLTCLVGPSGAGKTVLLKALAGRIELSKGQDAGVVTILENNQYLTLTSSAAKRSHIGLVSCVDELLPSATPKEALELSIALKSGNRSLDPIRQAQLVNFYLSLLDLDTCADTPFSNLPTLYQKRFSSLGVEMINERKVLLLDAPLRGLSQLRAYQFIKNLKKLVAAQHSVLSGILCSLLQPSSEVLSLFDDIILMAEQGVVVYQGRVADMASYFLTLGHVCPPHYNVSDFALFVLHSVTSEERERMAVYSYQRSASFVIHDDENSGDSAKHVRAAFWTQWRLLTVRQIRDVVRNWQSLLAARFVTSIVISLAIGFVYYDIGHKVDVNSDANSIHAYRGCVLVMCCNAMLANAQAILLTSPGQRSLFQREYSLNLYSSMAYLCSKAPIEAFLSSIQVMIQLLISYFLCQLQGNFAVYWVVLVAVAICAEAIAFSLTCITSNTLSAIQMMPIAILPQIIFSGLIVSIQSMPVWISWFQYLCFLPYAMKLLCINEFGCTDIAQFTTNDIQCSNIVGNALALVVIAVGFRLVALVVLQFTPRIH